VPYDQEWYWIDNKDFPSKRLFSFIMFSLHVTEPGDKQGAPVINGSRWITAPACCRERSRAVGAFLREENVATL
jgi:hypothetical protein